MATYSQSRLPLHAIAEEPTRTGSVLQRLRSLPIRWRILSIAILNTVIAMVFTALIWNGAKVITAARSDLRESRDSDLQLALLEGQAGRLQSLLHRYFT